MALIQLLGTAVRPGDTIEVREAGTLNLPTLYEDDGITLLGNPFTADLATGAFMFYTEDVDLDIVDTTGP